MNTMPPAQCLACNGSIIHLSFLLSSLLEDGLGRKRDPMLSDTHLFSRPSVLMGRMLLIGVGLGMAVACGGHRGGSCGGCLRLLRGLLLSLLHLRIWACLCCHGDQHACIGTKERACDGGEGQQWCDRTVRGGQEPHMQRDRWRQMDKEPQREGGGREGETEEVRMGTES